MWHVSHHTSHPGEGGSGGMVQVFRSCSFFHCVFRALQENSGEPCFHLHAATCILEPQACRGRLGLNGRDRKKREALLSEGAALALDPGLERKKRDRMCVGAYSQIEVPGVGAGSWGAGREDGGLDLSGQLDSSWCKPGLQSRGRVCCPWCCHRLGPGRPSWTWASCPCPEAP